MNFTNERSIGVAEEIQIRKLLLVLWNPRIQESVLGRRSLRQFRGGQHSIRRSGCLRLSAAWEKRIFFYPYLSFVRILEGKSLAYESARSVCTRALVPLKKVLISWSQIVWALFIIKVTYICRGAGFVATVFVIKAKRKRLNGVWVDVCDAGFVGYVSLLNFRLVHRITRIDYPIRRIVFLRRLAVNLHVRPRYRFWKGLRKIRNFYHLWDYRGLLSLAFNRAHNSGHIWIIVRDCLFMLLYPLNIHISQFLVRICRQFQLLELLTWSWTVLPRCYLLLLLIVILPFLHITHAFQPRGRTLMHDLTWVLTLK